MDNISAGLYGDTMIQLLNKAISKGIQGRDFLYMGIQQSKCTIDTIHDPHSMQIEMKECLLAQLHEIEKYKWYLGERLGHDPEKDRPIDEIYMEWIRLHAAEFREHWKQDQHKTV